MPNLEEIYRPGIFKGSSQTTENIALNKPTHQSKRYHNKNHDDSLFDSSNAVDGLKSDLSAFQGQCVISDNGQRNATWWVNLTSLHSIHDIRIYYRTGEVPWGSSNGYAARFLGFYVYVSNTTNRSEGHVCFHDTNYSKANIPAKIDIQCQVHGQYVIYYNERPQMTHAHKNELSENAYNELCEVEVNGCRTGYYGLNCSLLCPDKCISSLCHIETGACYGCKPGYKGDQCKEHCDNLTYGNQCMAKCGSCLGLKQCHYINGSCPEGCDAGYERKLCTKKCSDGKFGINCNDNCNERCGKPNKCNRISGECEGGCQPGWEGFQCQKKCRDNTYGKDCSQNCGNCRNGAAKCHHINGTCVDGCARGYKDMHCLTGCSQGTYGLNCMENCSTLCINNTCNPGDGECPKATILSSNYSDKINIGAVVGGSLGFAIAFFVVVLATILVLRRRNLQKYNSKKEETDKPKISGRGVLDTHFSTIDSKPLALSRKENRHMENRTRKTNSIQINDEEGDDDINETLHSEDPYGGDYANESAIQEITLEQLKPYIVEKRRNKDDGFQREYAKLPYGEKYKCDVGKKEENMVKNRYKTTFPYDHSRVILSKESGSDYINANYIEGAKHEKQYIAAQGPKKNTVADFWTMVWHGQVTAIVMLTNLKEENKIKCAKYWPDAHQNIKYDTVSVKTIEEKEYAFFNIRKLNVTNDETKMSRVVTQYHYTAWPDHGSPEPLSLVFFLDHVTRARTDQKDAPTVVHCSAGIGRTGTYIAIDVLKEIGKRTGKVNVVEYVKKMRENRMNMVQTYEQYMTIFLALNEIYKSPISFNTIGEFTTNSKNMTIDKPANKSLLRQEFQLLLKIRPVYKDDDFKLAREGCGDKYSNIILPLDKYSVHLSSVIPKRGNFINALMVPSYKNKRAFIVTQYPTAEDTVDFLRLLNDHESDTVICMDPLNKIDSSKAWLPSPSSSKAVPPFTVHVQSRSANDIISTTVHILEKNNEEEAHPVTVIEPKVSIETFGTPLDTSQLRSLVSATLTIETENPITIVSSDAAALCGVFCAVHNVIQQINMNDYVDVFTAVRQLQVRRPEFCSNFDEYRLVTKAVYDHIESTASSIYYNQ